MLRRTTVLRAFSGLLLLSMATAAAERPTWLACGPEGLLGAIEPLAEHRRAQGFDVVLSKGMPDAALAKLGRAPDYLLIVGDSVQHPFSDPKWLAPAKLGMQYRWREVQPEHFAADPLWADLDGDHIPDFPVGRIPARRSEEVTTVVNKIIAFEARDLGIEDLGLPIWGGTPAYGMLLDEAATTVLLSNVRKHAPAWSEPWLMFGNPRSPLSAIPAQQPNIFNDRLARGGYVTAMIGHGGPGSFLSQSTPSGSYGYEVSHIVALSGDRPAPPHIILACDCGTFDGGRTSLAESMLFARGGPVNVVAATTESHPLTNYYSALSALAAMDHGHARFGDFWHATQLAAFGTKHPISEAILKNAEGALEAEINIPKLKRDQLLMYALLGDPATLLPKISELELKITPLDDGWRWEVAKPDGHRELHVAIRRPSSPPRAKPDAASDELAMRLFEQRNAAWTFTPIAEIPADSAWSGTIDGPGLLRLVAPVPGGLAVATAELMP